MDFEASTLLEAMLLNESAEPMDLPISLLKLITGNFNDDLCIGRGAFGVVYKGSLENGGIVAVKKLSNEIDIDETKYNREVHCLLRVRHKNIVRFLGYCANTHGKMWPYEGKFVMADVKHRLLCFEYLAKGSLHGYIKDASCGQSWIERYQIIKGICEGLHYLHEQSIVHLDLKPANILLNDDMVPKISDFGLSRWFDEQKNQAIITSNVEGTRGYVAPERYDGVITFKSDIYSLGVIFGELLTGQKGHSPVENVVKSWKERLDMPMPDNLLEQVKLCAEICISCTDHDPKKRPSIDYIIQKLKTDVTQGTKIQRLPRGIGKVKRLRHPLMADRCADRSLAVFPNISGKQEPEEMSNLSEFPYRFGVEAPNDISSLEELQTLETVEASKGLAEQLKKLMQLRCVWIHNLSAADCANIFATLSNMPVLSSLLLCARDKNETLSFEALQPISRKLHKLIIIGQWARGTLECPIFCDHGTCLKYLDISWCSLREDPVVMLAPYLRNLTYLSLKHMPGAKTLVFPERSFPQLKMLVLKNMPDVNELVICDGALPCIVALCIVSLARLDMVPRGMESLRSLRKLWLLNLHRNFRTQWDKNRMSEKMEHVLKIDI